MWNCAAGGPREAEPYTSAGAGGQARPPASEPLATADPGHRLENAVYLALRRRREPVSYAGETGYWECDFVSGGEAIQVCVELTSSNVARELRGVLGGAGLPGRRRPLILTLDQRDRIATQGATVEVVPAWEWLSKKGGG